MWYNNPNSGNVVKVLQHYFSLCDEPLKFRCDGRNQFGYMEMRSLLNRKSKTDFDLRPKTRLDEYPNDLKKSPSETFISLQTYESKTWDE